MTDRELMQQALEALDNISALMRDPEDMMIADVDIVLEAATALRERLAQPEQTVPSDHSNSHQPEQWEQFYPDMGNPLDRMAENARELGLDYEPVNTKVNFEAIPKQISVQEPVAWMSKVISHYEELRRIIDNGSESMTHEDAVEYLKELVKLNERPYKPEPVAWMFTNQEGSEYCSERDDRVGIWTPLYIPPPRREWVGLTEEEIESCNQTTTDWGAPCVWLWDDALEEGGIQFARAIEAKLREKNA